MNDDRLLETLAAAFVNDPLYRWLYPDESTRPDALLANLQLTLTLVGERGHVDTTPDGMGVALWTGPRVELLEDPEPFVDLLRRWAPDRVDSALAGMAACSEYSHPSDAVLHMLAVHPSHQGRGVASRLIMSALQEYERRGIPVYLESSNPRNLSFYERCGFLVLGEVEVPNGGPVMRPMRRHAGGG